MTATGLASSCQVRETVNRLRVPGVVYELSPQFPFAERRESVVTLRITRKNPCTSLVLSGTEASYY